VNRNTKRSALVTFGVCPFDTEIRNINLSKDINAVKIWL